MKPPLNEAQPSNKERLCKKEPPRLLDAVRLAIRARHYSRRTEKAYVGWVRRYVIFHDKRLETYTRGVIGDHQGVGISLINWRNKRFHSWLVRR